MSRNETNALPFTIDVFGKFSANQVKVEYDPTPRPTTPVLEELIAIEWERQTKLAVELNRLLFNGSLLRYVSHVVASTAGNETEKAADSIFHLTVGPTCYRDFVGTNLFNNNRIDEFGWDHFANPIGTTATLITQDGMLFYGRRSSRVSYHADHVHTFGGALEERDRSPDGRVDPFGSVSRELTEELNLAPNELHELCCVGLLRDTEIRQPEMLFEATLTLTSEQLQQRWREAEAQDEHEELVMLQNEPDAIVPFVKSCRLIAPVAIGSLFIHGRLLWGDSWFTAAARALTGTA